MDASSIGDASIIIVLFAFWAITEGRKERYNEMVKFKKDLRVITMFVLPALLIYLIFAVTPIVQSIYFAFFDWNGIFGVPLEFAGLDNFRSLFQMGEFYHTFSNAFIFAALNLIFQIPLGYFLAYLLADFCKGYQFFKTIFFSSVILPMTATALLFKFVFGPNNNGIINSVLVNLGISDGNIGWLLQPSTALLSIIIANAWCGFGYHMTIGFAAISGIPEEIMEASEIDGVTGFRRIIKIVIPMIWEPLKTSVVLIITGSIKVFDIVFVMTEGGPNGLTQVPSTLLYNEAFKYSNYGTGSAVSVLIFVVSLLLAVLSMRIMKENAQEM